MSAGSYATPPPIFVGGCVKSGTTLARRLLAQHSRIAGGLETHWFEIDLERWTGRKGQPLDVHLGRLAAFYDVERERVEGLARDARSCSQFLDGFMAAVAYQNNKPRWVEKTPENILHLDTIASHWPDAIVVHVVRDPRDVFVSMLETGKVDSLETFIGYWARFFKSAQHSATRAGPDRLSLVEISYERMVTETRAVMVDLAAAIGESFEEAMAHYEGADDEFHKVRQVTGVESPTLRRMTHPLTTTRIGVWKNALAPQIVKELGAEATRSGLGETYARLTAGRAD